MFRSIPSRLALGLSAVSLTLFGFGLYTSSAASSDDQAINSLGGVDSVRFLSLPTNDVIFNTADNKLYTSVPSSAGNIGNSITPIDPYSGAIGTSVFVGSEPTRLALANDGQTLYTFLAGAYSIGRFNTATQTTVGSFLIGYDSFYGFLVTSDIAVSPDNPNVVALARQSLTAAPSQVGVAIYNNGARLPQTGPSHIAGSDLLTFTESGTTLYGSGNDSGLKRYNVTATGASESAQASLVARAQLKYSGGTIFAASGQVINAASMSLLGTFPGVSGNGAFVPDTAAGRVYFLTQDPAPNTWILRAYSIATFTQVGTLTISNVSGNPTSLVRWGTNGLAFRTAGGQICLIQTSLIPTPNPIPPPSPTPIVTPTPTPTPYAAAIRQLQFSTNDLVYSSSRQKFYATVPSTAGVERGNTLTEIDPATGNLGTSTLVGSEPGQLAISDDGSTVFIGINGSGGFRKFDLATSTAGPIVSLTTPLSGFQTAFDIDVLPGSTDSVAINRSPGPGFSPSGIAMYDGGVLRPTIGQGGQYIKFASSDVLFSNGVSTTNGTSMTKHGVQPGGISQIAAFGQGTTGEIDVKNGRVYSANGRVIDTGFTSVAGSYTGLASLSLGAFDVENNKAFFYTVLNDSYVIRAYELDTFRPIGSVTLPDLSGQGPRKLVRWGTNGLAFRTDSRVYIIQTNLVDGGAPPPPPAPTPTITPTPSPTPAATFIRKVNIPANDLVYNTQTNTVVASIAGIAGGSLGNTMTHIDPATGQLLGSTFLGSEPKMIAASDDGQRMWVTLSGANSIRLYDAVTRAAGLQFNPPANFQNVQDMAVMPGNYATLAIASRQSGVALFDNGIQRPEATNGGADAINSIEFTENPNILYGYDNESSDFELVKFTANPNGLTGTMLPGRLLSGFSTHIRYLDGVLYSTNGRAVNPNSLTVVGTYQGSGSTMAIDAAANRIFFLSGNVLSAFDLQTFVKIGSVGVPGYSGTPTSLARWGTNGLVFRASTSFSGPDSQVYLIQSALVSPSAAVPTGIALGTAVASGFENNGIASINILRNGDLSTSSSVDYATADGTAVAGSDYTARAGNVVFAPGETSKTISIPIINDNIFEGTENFSINLSNATGTNVFIVSPSSASINISDNDPRPSVSNTGTTIQEPSLGRNAVANVQVQLTNPSVETVTVNFNTSNGTATSGTDYIATNGVVTFAPLETVKSIPIEVLPDTLTEPNETFTIGLSNAVNSTISSGTATVTISNLNHAAHMYDFDGDFKSDVGIFRPSVAEWWIYRSSTGSTFAAQFGGTTDKITPADFTGDGKTDVAFWRPSTGEWFVVRSEDNTYFSAPFGATGDIPVPADYDADGKADVAVFRPSTGFWFVHRSSDSQTTAQLFGVSGDQPIPADYDGDGRADVAIYRPSDGQWWLDRTTSGTIAYGFGNNTDKLVPGDYTGDGKTDVAFWRPSTGEWFILRSEDTSYYSAPFGTDGDIPAPGDYDGDGKFDVTVFRPSGGSWFVNRTTGGTSAQQFGANGDLPLESAFIP